MNNRVDIPVKPAISVTSAEKLLTRFLQEVTQNRYRQAHLVHTYADMIATASAQRPVVFNIGQNHSGENSNQEWRTRS